MPPQVLRILPVFLLYCLAVGAIAVPKLNIIINLLCYQYHLPPNSRSRFSPSKGTPAECQTAAVQSHTARFFLCANVISGCLCAFSSPRLSALSDRYGRKKILAFTATGMLLGDVITLVVAWFPDHISVYVILLEFAFGGLAGTFVATMAVIQSYAADCTSPGERSTSFGRLHACTYAGAAAGPILGGLFIKYLGGGDLLSVFYLAAVCHGLFIIFVLTYIPESLSPERQALARAFDFEQRSLLTSPKPTIRRSDSVLSTASLSPIRPLAILLPQAGLPSRRLLRRNLILLALIDTVIFGVILSITHILVLYSTYTFHLSIISSSALISITNASRVVALIGVLPLVSRVFSSLNTIRVSILVTALSSFTLALAPTFSLFTLSSAVSALSALASPTLQAILTTLVPERQTGELLGAISLLHALARIVIPGLLDLIYSLTVVKGGGGAVFVWLAGIFTVVFGASLGIRLGSGVEEQDSLDSGHER